jgi:osmoprotectant transport system permease protein
MIGRFVIVVGVMVAMLAAVSAIMLLSHRAARRDIVIGAKNFTESRVLMEVMAQAIERGCHVEVARQELGSTALCFDALRAGELSAYPEYSGTLGRELLSLPASADDDAIARGAARLGLLVLPALGLNDTYVLAMRQDRARSLGLATLSGLASHHDLTCGFTSEFIQREDGLPGLAKVYGLAFAKPPVDLAPSHQYPAVRDGMVDVISAFSTDARLRRFELVALRDDRSAFPAYRAMPLVNALFAQRHPEAVAALRTLAGAIDDETMRKLNAQVDLEGASPRQVASSFLDQLESHRLSH